MGRSAVGGEGTEEMRNDMTREMIQGTNGQIALHY